MTAVKRFGFLEWKITAASPAVKKKKPRRCERKVITCTVSADAGCRAKTRAPKKAGKPEPQSTRISRNTRTELKA